MQRGRAVLERGTILSENGTLTLKRGIVLSDPMLVASESALDPSKHETIESGIHGTGFGWANGVLPGSSSRVGKIERWVGTN